MWAALVISGNRGRLRRSGDDSLGGPLQRPPGSAIRFLRHDLRRSVRPAFLVRSPGILFAVAARTCAWGSDTLHSTASDRSVGSPSASTPVTAVGFCGYGNRRAVDERALAHPVATLMEVAWKQSGLGGSLRAALALWQVGPNERAIRLDPLEHLLLVRGPLLGPGRRRHAEGRVESGFADQIGRASCKEGVEISVVAW